MKIPFFNKPNKYQAPQVASIPEGQSTDNNGTYIDEAHRQIIIKIHDDGSPNALRLAVGDIGIGMDIVKATLTQWHMKEAQRKAILTPNGNGGHHVI